MHNVIKVLFVLQFSDPSAGQWIDILVKGLIFPFVSVMQFAWRSGHSWILTMCVMTSCAINTAFEANMVIQLATNEAARSVYSSNICTLMCAIEGYK